MLPYRVCDERQYGMPKRWAFYYLPMAKDHSVLRRHVNDVSHVEVVSTADTRGRQFLLMGDSLVWHVHV